MNHSTRVMSSRQQIPDTGRIRKNVSYSISISLTVWEEDVEQEGFFSFCSSPQIHELTLPLVDSQFIHFNQSVGSFSHKSP